MNYLPVKSCDIGDGIFFSAAMSVGILLVGLATWMFFTSAPGQKMVFGESGRAKLVYDRPILPDHTMVKCCQVSRFLPGALGLQLEEQYVDVGKFDVPIHHHEIFGLGLGLTTWDLSNVPGVLLIALSTL